MRVLEDVDGSDWISKHNANLKRRLTKKNNDIWKLHVV